MFCDDKVPNIKKIRFLYDKKEDVQKTNNYAKEKNDCHAIKDNQHFVCIHKKFGEFEIQINEEIVVQNYDKITKIYYYVRSDHHGKKNQHLIIIEQDHYTMDIK